MKLVGREAEQSAIASLLSCARAGKSATLALVGEPGIGKSALLDLGRQLATGMRVLSARGAQTEAQIPFAGLSELLRPALRQIHQIPPYQAAALEGALALLPARPEDRFAIGAATLSLLAACSEEAPLLIVIDDAQWLDWSSLDATLFALRRLVADPVAALFGARTGETSLLDANNVACLKLNGLDLAAATTLVTEVAGKIPDDLVVRLHQQTGGNPLALVEAASDIERFRLSAPLDVPLPIVSRVADVYVSRVRSLSEQARTALLLAAASDMAEAGTLARSARVLGLDIEQLAEAENYGLVELRDGRVEFRHPLIRSAVYGSCSPQERRRAHKAIAQALPEGEADRRAWHLALSAMGPDEAACSALEQAARRGRARNAFDVASKGFERASLLAGEVAAQARLLTEAAEAAWEAGQGSRARELLERAEQKATCTSTLGAARHLRGQVISRSGPVAQGLAVLIEAAEIASQYDPERAAVILSEAVNTAFYAGDASSMQSVARGIAAIEPQLCNGRARFFATMAQGMALTFAGEPAKGAALLREAVELALSGLSQQDDPKWLTWAAMGPIWLRETGAARALVGRAADVARSRAAIGLLPYLLSHVAIDHATTSRWAEAEATFHEAIQLSRETQQRTDRAAALARLASLEARQGKEAQSLAHASEAIELADELGLLLCKVWALAALGEMHLVAGRNAEAIAHFCEQRHLLVQAGVTDVDLSPVPELVELHLRRGSIGNAARLAAEYQAQAAAKGLPWALARAARCRGLLADDGQVDDIFCEALGTHAKTPDLFETARTYLAYGGKLRRARRRGDARRQLQAALDIFNELGAAPWFGVASHELAATGITTRRRDESTRYSLTPQELQIALLLARKYSTKQAAAALFLSPKTVEYHLRSIYRKLGCNTREGLASALEGSRR